MLKTTLRAPRVYRWREICQHLTSKRERDFVVAAQRFGLHDGVTMGSADQDNRLVAFCSFASDQSTWTWFDSEPVPAGIDCSHMDDTRQNELGDRPASRCT